MLTRVLAWFRVPKTARIAKERDYSTEFCLDFGGDTFFQKDEAFWGRNTCSMHLLRQDPYSDAYI